MEIDGTQGHGNGCAATDTFRSWGSLVEAWYFELLFWKGVYVLLCRRAQLLDKSDGMVELSNKIARFLQMTGVEMSELKARCALCHLVINSTMSDLMKAPPEGCFFDYADTDSKSIRRFLRGLALEYRLSETIFVSYGKDNI